MKIVARFALFVFFAATAVCAVVDTQSQIESVLNTQLEQWNRGDIPAFVTTYAADCTFVGKEIAHGRAQLLARYQNSYPTREAMGRLTFSALQIRVLTTDVAIATGEWHISRPGPSTKSVGGLFSLVFQRHGNEWKIVLDHTS